MRRFLIATLLAVPVLAATTQDASAFFSTCCELHKKWSFTCPRIIFGVDSGCAAPYTPISYGAPHAGMNQHAAAAMPWYASGYGQGTPAYAYGQQQMMQQQMMQQQAPAQPPAATQPVSYQQYQQYPTANYGYYHSAPAQGVPAYWYFR